MIKDVQDIIKKRDEITELREQLSITVQATQAQPVKIYPKFEEYGWSRLDTYVMRLRDALDDPLAEECRQILEKAGLLLDLTTIKSIVRANRQEALSIATQIFTELNEVKDKKVKKRSKDEIEMLLKTDEWNKSLIRAKEWKLFSISYDGLQKQPSTALRILALSEMLDQGTESSIEIKYRDMQQKAIALGNNSLWQILANESYETLNDAEIALNNLSTLKTGIEQIKGEQFDLKDLLKKQTNIAAIQKYLQNAIDRTRKELAQTLTDIELFLNRVNNLSRLAEESQEDPKQLSSLKEAQDYQGYLNKRLAQLREKIRQTLEIDAVILADSLSEKKVPIDWTSVRVVKALKELLKKYSFRLEI